MKHRSLLVAFLVSLPLFAQDGQMPQPGPEHQKLHAHAGTWDAVIESTGPDGKPSKSLGVSEMKMALGGFWLVDDFTAEFMGMQFQGHGLTGYDPVKGKYVATWVDSMSPSLLVLEGSYDKDGKVLTMSGPCTGMDGKPAQCRTVSTSVDANTMVFEMYMTGGDGTEALGMKITYTRRAAKPGAGKPASDKPPGRKG